MSLIKYILILLSFLTIGYSIYHQIVFPIPRVIHYVWVGNNPLPIHVQKVIKTWEYHAPNYRINKIDESNCDVNANIFVREAYAQKAWNFVSDYCRFVTLEKEGGLYLDTDHILKGSPDELLRGANRVFTLEKLDSLSGSFIAVKPHDPVIQQIIRWYDKVESFDKETFEGYYSAPIPVTKAFKEIIPIDLHIKSYDKNGTRVLPTNIAMLNLGGGESKAEHLYDNLIGTNKKGHYYQYFLDIFLEQATLPFCDNGKKHFIFKNNKTGYFYETKQEADILLNIPNKIILHWKDTNKTHTYIHLNNCYFPKNSIPSVILDIK